MASDVLTLHMRYRYQREWALRLGWRLATFVGPRLGWRCAVAIGDSLWRLTAIDASFDGGRTWEFAGRPRMSFTRGLGA